MKTIIARDSVRTYFETRTRMIFFLILLHQTTAIDRPITFLIPTRLPGGFNSKNNTRDIPSSGHFFLCNHVSSCIPIDPSTSSAYLQFQIFYQGGQDLFPVLTQRSISVRRASHTAVFNLVSRGLCCRKFWKDWLVAIFHHCGIFFLNGR